MTRDQAVRLVDAALTTGDAAAALSAYNLHFPQSGADDLALLQRIARAALERIAADPKSPASIDALGRLARAGDTSARTKLGLMATGPDSESAAGQQADFALVRLGDDKAIARVTEQLADPDSRLDKAAAISALADVRNQQSAYAMVASLQDPNPAVAMAAARALTELGSRQVVGDVRSAFDMAQGPAKLPLAAALKALGSDAADEYVSRMLKSPAPDVQLMAAEALARGRAPGWEEHLKPFLTAASVDTRLRAAELLAPVDPAANQAISRAARDPNPATRDTAALILERTGSGDVAVLRTLLGDTSPLSRVSAAGALLRLPVK